MRVLIIEEHLPDSELVRDYLTVSGFQCDTANDGESGLRMALSEEYALVILDVMLPKRDGFSVCSELRKVKDIPIIFLSARSEDIDKVRGLGLGADDYMTKPFSPAELVARVKAHISRYERLMSKAVEKKPHLIQVRDLKIDKDAHRVYVAEKEVSMPVREFELLLFLAENPNIVFSKERLFDRLWGIDAMGDVATVTVHIQRIREKIEKDSDNKKYIETVWGAGYRFRA